MSVTSWPRLTVQSVRSYGEHFASVMNALASYLKDSPHPLRVREGRQVKKYVMRNLIKPSDRQYRIYRKWAKRAGL